MKINRARSLLLLLFYWVKVEGNKEKDIIMALASQLKVQHIILVEPGSMSTIPDAKYFAQRKKFVTFMNVNFFIYYLENLQFVNSKTIIVAKNPELLRILRYIHNYQVRK